MRVGSSSRPIVACRMAGPVYAGYRSGGLTTVGVGDSLQPGGPKPSRGTRATGRPPFGLGPIARVSTVQAPQQPAPEAVPPGQVARPPERRFGVTGAGSPPGGYAPGGGHAPGGGFTPGGGFAPGARPDPARTRAFGLPNLRRNVCPHFYVTGTRGALPIHAPHLLKGIVRQDSVISRCQLRGGVHLEQSYVNDVCLSPRFNQCVFYEEELSGR